MNYLKLLIILFTLQTISAQELVVYNESNSPLTVNELRSLAIDSLNNIWIADGKSLYQFNGDWSTDLAEFDSCNISDIAISPNNTIWISTITGLTNQQVNQIFYKNGDVWKSLVHYFGVFDPVNISIKSDTTIYFTLVNNWPNQLGDDEIGIFKNNGFTEFNPANLWGINSVVSLNGDSLLAADWYGINLFDGTNWHLQIPVVFDPKSLVKIGSDIFVIGDSLYKYENGTYKTFPLVDSILVNDSLTISSLAVERGRTLWIGTDKGKLIKYNENTIKVFNLTTASIIDIAIDKDSNKWFLSSEGCFEFNEDQIVEVENEVVEIPAGYSLSQNYPNPFNPSTIIEYSLPLRQAGIPAVESGYIPTVQLIIYDILGREIAVLVNENQKPGYYKVNFDASRLASGIYYYRIQSGNYSETKKMILLK